MRFYTTFIQILKNINTRPTKFFILLVISIIGLFSLAYMHNYNIVYIVMFFLFSLAAASSIIGRLNLYELSAIPLQTNNLFADSSSEFIISLENPTVRDRYNLEVTYNNISVPIPILPANNANAIALQCDAYRRGKHDLGDITISSVFPLVHEVLYFSYPLDKEVIIFPQPKGSSLEEFLSRHKSQFGEQDDFDGIKRYEQGESLSKIFWPSLAKNRELMSKEFVTLEQSAYLHFYLEDAGKELEEQLSQLCLWIIECKQRSLPYIIHFPNAVLDSTKRSHDEILTFLALY